ncbi:MAG: hypothetical protein FWF59_12025 [Turicibacter sp.]|nr:hypothetical protein [Turicibacter sp.]
MVVIKMKEINPIFAIYEYFVNGYKDDSNKGEIKFFFGKKDRSESVVFTRIPTEDDFKWFGWKAVTLLEEFERNGNFKMEATRIWY